jgi:hypothetical protein
LAYEQSAPSVFFVGLVILYESLDFARSLLMPIFPYIHEDR